MGKSAMFLKVIADMCVCGCKTASTFSKKCMSSRCLFTKLPSLMASVKTFPPLRSVKKLTEFYNHWGKYVVMQDFDLIYNILRLLSLK